MPAASEGRCNPAGFQVIELVLVATIIGLVLAAAIPSFVGSNSWRNAEGAARDFSARLQQVRELAVTNRVYYRARLDPHDLAYSFERQTSDSTWTRDPNEIYQVTGCQAMTTEIGGAQMATLFNVEPQGTIEMDQAPARICFLSTKGDSAVVSAVRTGRVSVRMVTHAH